MIKHILADGRELKDITGHKVPRTNNTETAYRLLRDFTEGGRNNAQRSIQQNYGKA